MNNKKIQVFQVFIKNSNNCLSDTGNLIFHLYLSYNFIFCSKRSQINSTDCLIMKIHNKKELENIATNNSEDVDYKDFMNINKKMYKSTIFFFGY